MNELRYEIRDPVHATIRFSANEKKAIDSAPVQRLRYIRQLGLTYLLYPGANHTRFEHAMGTMELSGRVFDAIVEQHPAEVIPSVSDLLAEQHPRFAYWRRVVRMAALCHDIGHLPFSHTAEEEVLPSGYSHERLTYELIKSPVMQAVWSSMESSLEWSAIAKLAIGPKKWKLWSGSELSEWESILSEIITGNAFGVDRMDYLLRDSHHVGVAYGKIDHHRLVDTIRILPAGRGKGMRFTLGVRQGGLHTAEAMMLARYFMFRQVYCHPVSQIYGIYLIEFLKRYLKDKTGFEDLAFHQRTTDNEVLAWLRESPQDAAAQAILARVHYKLLFEPKEEELKLREPGKRIYEAMIKRFPEAEFRHQPHKKHYETPVFPVLRRDDQSIDFSDEVSELLRSVPAVLADYVFVSDKFYEPAVEHLRLHRRRILSA